VQIIGRYMASNVAWLTMGRMLAGATMGVLVITPWGRLLNSVHLKDGVSVLVGS